MNARDRSLRRSGERVVGHSRRRRSIASGAIVGLLVASLGAGCQVAEPYLMPRRTVEMLTNLQTDLRPDAQLPMVRERDRAPVLVRRRALNLTEDEFARATTRASRFYRVQASDRPPMFYVGGVVLGMALPYLVTGLMTGLDPIGSVAPTRAITDIAGGATMLSLSVLHLGVGGLLIALGDRRPQVEPADRGLVQQYVDGTAPLLISGPPPPKDDPPPSPEAPDAAEAQPTNRTP